MNAKKIVVFVLALVLVVGSVGGIFAVLSNGDDSGGSAGPAASSTAATSGTTRVEFSGTGGKEFCAADAQLNDQLSKQAPTTREPAGLAAYFQKKVTAIKQLETLAPAEIKADIATTIGAYQAFEPLLAAAGWDQSKVTKAQTAAIQTPGVTAAGQRLQQYTERVCKLVPKG